MKSSSAPEAAKMRVSFQDHGALSAMPEQWWESLFRLLASSPATIMIEARDTKANKLAGFIIAATNFRDVKACLVTPTFLIQSIWNLFLGVFQQPDKLFAACKGLLRRQQSYTIPPQRWLTWIVDKNYRGAGIGTELYRELCTRMRHAGVDKFYGPVACDNSVSNNAHLALGARKLSVIYLEGSRHFLWEHDTRAQLRNSKNI
jgi:ribosomal protein S18 acetylase RimI-like enzyme